MCISRLWWGSRVAYTRYVDRIFILRVVAIALCAVAVVVGTFLLVWFLLHRGDGKAPAALPPGVFVNPNAVTADSKAQLLEKLKTSASSTVSADQKRAILDSFNAKSTSTTSQSTGLTAEEKIKILESFKKQ